MGALHGGHLDLVKRATELAPTVIVTDFVNPLQFGPGEDFDAYPRTLDADLAALEGTGADVLYAPSAADMYPDGEPLVRVDPGPLGAVYEGAIRPGHFAGVCTVVTKLFARTRADLAVFGQKDAQQLAVIRRLVHDLDLPIQIEAVPIHRDPDGLATSSRNRYLSPAERAVALALPRAVRLALFAADAGEPAGEIRTVVWDSLRDGHLEVDYADLVDPATFTPLGDGDSGDALLVLAARVGSTRLIDNTALAIR
jgi:pantoate--beta-alanine ligase